MTAHIREIEDGARAHAYSGVLSIFAKERIIYNNAFGYRSTKDELPNTSETLFGIASGTKSFTALGIGQLIDQGQLTLATKVGDIDASYTGFIDPAATIQHLLTHTSGIFDYYDEELITDFDHYSVSIPWSALETSADYWPLFVGQTKKFSPGERYSYSNGGFVFLGLLIEKITGQLYRDFMEKAVLRPAGMTRSGFYAFNDLPANTAYGYLSDLRTTNIYQLPMRGGGDGGMYTTTDDLRLFWQHFFADEIISPELRAQFLATHYAFDKKSGYGCGIYKELDDSAFSLSGEDAGVSFYSRYYPREEISVNLLSNTADGVGAMRKVLVGQTEQMKKDLCGI